MSTAPLDIPPREAAAALATGAPILVDCREPWEHELVHLEGSVLLPLRELADRIDELPRDRPVVVYCHHGIRSRHAAALLREAGFPDARSLAGGIDLWSVAIDPTVPRY